jgi:hypothetical protein
MDRANLLPLYMWLINDGIAQLTGKGQSALSAVIVAEQWWHCSDNAQGYTALCIHVADQ